MSESRSDTGEAIRERHRDARDRAFDGLTIAPWIGGESVETGETITTRDPVTNEAIVDVPACSPDDVDLDTAVEAVTDGIYYSTGEICDAFSRALVH